MFILEFRAKDGTRVTFREPKMSDMRNLMRMVNSVTCEPMSGLMINRRIGLKEEKDWLSARLKEIRRRETVMVVVEADGRIVGNCDVKRRGFKEEHRAVLGIVLVKEFRGKGIGEALMKNTIALTKERMKGVEQIDLQTFSYNKRAQALYRKLGFVKIGEVPRAVKEAGRLYGEHLMVLYL